MLGESGQPVSEVKKLTNKAVADALDGLPAYKMHCIVFWRRKRFNLRWRIIRTGRETIYKSSKEREK